MGDRGSAEAHRLGDSDGSRRSASAAASAVTNPIGAHARPQTTHRRRPLPGDGQVHRQCRGRTCRTPGTAGDTDVHAPAPVVRARRASCPAAPGDPRAAPAEVRTALLHGHPGRAARARSARPRGPAAPPEVCRGDADPDESGRGPRDPDEEGEGRKAEERKGREGREGPQTRSRQTREGEACAEAAVRPSSERRFAARADRHGLPGAEAPDHPRAARLPHQCEGADRRRVDGRARDQIATRARRRPDQGQTGGVRDSRRGRCRTDARGSSVARREGGERRQPRPRRKLVP